MELEQVTIPNDLLQNLILPNTTVKTILAAGSTCRQWHSWIKREQFWHNAFNTIYYFVESAPTESFKISWRKLCIQASAAKLPTPGTFASEVGSQRGGVVTGAKYNVQLKMDCKRREEIMEVNVDCLYPLLKPGSSGNPEIKEGLRVFAMWKKQNFWVGRIQTVNWQDKTVFHVWEDNDKDTLPFNEVFVYPTKEQIDHFRQRIRNGELYQERVFASRANLGERCGPYHEGVLNSIDSSWLIKFEEEHEVHWLEPSRLNIREKIESSTIVPKLMSWMDPAYRGSRVLYHTQTTQGVQRYALGQIPDEDDFANIWLADENPNQGSLSFNILYIVIGQDKLKRHMPHNKLLRVVNQKKLVRDMTVYFPLDNFYEEGSIDSIVPGPSGMPDRVQVSKTRWSEDIPPIYHFSSN
eukprot:TRINITY_DN10881_c0_g1_i1.p1 TRINITY_DN10881_c0_g1~~TRINITY_DN10881_c0_g1_i1.p1  ORF type:complete len:410 (+),score=52.26 TRINITY_DN10881_c0_g1_i1:320-1549(+)